MDTETRRKIVKLKHDIRYSHKAIGRMVAHQFEKYGRLELTARMMGEIAAIERSKDEIKELLLTKPEKCA